MKKYIAKIIRCILPKTDEHIIVASTGRAGSTVLFKSLVRGYLNSRVKLSRFVGKRILFKIYGEFYDRLSKVGSCAPKIIKTHDEFNIEIEGAKYIFIYGDPLESVLSAERMDKFNHISAFYKHMYHLRGNGHFSDRYTKDVLNYEGQIKSWMYRNRSDVLVVRYDELWSSKEKIEQFVGFPFTLPSYRQRSIKDIPEGVDWALFAYLRKIAADYQKKFSR